LQAESVKVTAAWPPRGASNALGLIVYVVVIAVPAIAKGDPAAYLVTYLLASPNELRLSTYVTGGHSLGGPRH